jgi:hypothetical protein
MRTPIVIFRPSALATTIDFWDNVITGDYLWQSLGDINEMDDNSPALVIQWLRNIATGSACTQDTADTDAFRIREHTSAVAITFAYNIIPGTTNGVNNHHCIQVGESDGAKLYNNVLTGGDDGLFLNTGPGAISNLDCRNNIIVDNRAYGINGAAASFTAADHNCVYNNTTANYNGAGLAAGANDINADPLMVDPANADFRLTTNSPCINRGTPVGLSVDYAGNSIKGLPDIGAYESPDKGAFVGNQWARAYVANVSNQIVKLLEVWK